MKLISERAFNELKTNGHCVPRVYDPADRNDSITHFAVSKEYKVSFKGSKEVLNVRCTQNCPINIKVI